MKLIHLSDLHIGKRVNEVSMLEDQSHILDQILDITRQEQPDAVLIAGDVYDKTVPSAEAVSLLDSFFSRLVKLGVPVLVISGNHDSAERLAFGGELLTGAGLYLSPVYDGHLRKVTLEDEFGPVDFWLMPFLKPGHVRRFYPEETIETYTDALRVALSHTDRDESRRNVLLTHQFVTGAAICESEELSVGGSDNVDVTVFDGFNYVALGHIHGPQNIGSTRVRYCGTPLKYSFSEANHHKSVTVVQLGEKGELTVSTLPLTPLRDLRQLRGTYEELTAKKNYENTAVEDYLHITLTDEEDVHEAMARLRVIYPNLMKLTYDNARTRSSGVLENAGDVQKKSHLELFRELYEQQNNQPMSQVQTDYLCALIESIWEDSK